MSTEHNSLDLNRSEWQSTSDSSEMRVCGTSRIGLNVPEIRLPSRADMVLSTNPRTFLTKGPSWSLGVHRGAWQESSSATGLTGNSAEE